MTEWQPIETAPKDGTVIDIWRRHYELESPRSPVVIERGERIANCFWNGKGWYAKLPSEERGAIDIEHRNGWEAILWMPLPEPPK